ncbi:hypothetical protein I4I73_28790, partial [Pseudonocardia sp. KRD-184]
RPGSPAAVPLRRHPRAALRVLLVRWVPVSALPALVLSVTAAVAAGEGGQTIAWADQDEVLALAVDAVPGLLAPFVEPDPH